MSPEMKWVKFLGKGTSGSVDLVRYKQKDGSNIYKAVKVSADSLDSEFEILKELEDCPGVIQLFGNTLLGDIDSNGNRVQRMAMEYASGGTLTCHIKRNRGKLSGSMVKEFTRTILQGLVSIHSHGYVHCDLKPDNVLLFPVYDEKTWNCSYELKISDFGLSTKSGQVSDIWEPASPFVGTPVYMSPESVQNGLVEKALDLWSLGCLVLEMYTGKHPWSGVSTRDLQTLLSHGNTPNIPNNVPCDARKFLDTCFASKAQQRGTASELLSHPFFMGPNVPGGETRRLGSRIRKPPEKFEDIAKKPSKLKVIPTKAQQFKKIPNKKLKILPPAPPRSNLVLV